MNNINKQDKPHTISGVSRSFSKNCYRVVKDSYNGYEAQVKFWWFSFFWLEMWEKRYLSNTWTTLQDAKDFIKNGSKKKTRNKRVVYWVSENCN